MIQVTQEDERDDLGLVMLAAWLNVRVDQIPPENRAHLNPHTMAAWERVGRAAVAYAHNLKEPKE